MTINRGTDVRIKPFNPEFSGCLCHCLSLTFCILWLPFREREEPPRFARPGTFEFEYAKRWKSLDEMEKQQRQQVEKNMQEAREKLEAEMEDAFHEHQANLLRQGRNSRY